MLLGTGEGGGEGGHNMQMYGGLAPLRSRLRLLKFSLARLVLENANLTNSVSALQRLVAHYQLSTGQDLMALMHWFVDQLQGGNGQHGQGYHDRPVAFTPGPGGESSEHLLKSRVYGPISAILARLNQVAPKGKSATGRSGTAPYGASANVSRELRQMLESISQQVMELRHLADRRGEEQRLAEDRDRRQLQQAIRSLSNQTHIIESRLEDQVRARAFGGAGAAGAASGGRGRGGGGGPYYYGSAYPAATAAVSYSEYEILQHQKEELEMQNRRLVERISKLKYILKVASRQKNARLEGIFQLFSHEMEKLSYKVHAIISRYLSLRSRYRSFAGYARRFGARASALVAPLQREIGKVVRNVRLKSALPVDDRFRLYNLSAELGFVADFGRNVSAEGYLDLGGGHREKHDAGGSSRYGSDPVDLMQQRQRRPPPHPPPGRSAAPEDIPEVDIAPGGDKEDDHKEEDGKALLDPSVYTALHENMDSSKEHYGKEEKYGHQAVPKLLEMMEKVEKDEQPRKLEILKR